MAHQPRPTAPAGSAGPTPGTVPDQTASDALGDGVADLVEDVSIDGMCGVY